MVQITSLTSDTWLALTCLALTCLALPVGCAAKCPSVQADLRSSAAALHFNKGPKSTASFMPYDMPVNNRTRRKPYPSASQHVRLSLADPLWCMQVVVPALQQAVEAQTPTSPQPLPRAMQLVTNISTCLHALPHLDEFTTLAARSALCTLYPLLTVCRPFTCATASPLEAVALVVPLTSCHRSIKQCMYLGLRH